MPSPTIILIILLAISVAGNGLLGKLYVGAKADLGKQEQATAEARAAGLKCSAGVEKLQADADARAKKARVAVAAAQQTARLAEKRSQDILATAPADPTDACKSADLLNQAQIAARKAQK